MLERRGFSVDTPATAFMHWLEPGRFIRDEGPVRSLRLAWRLMPRPAARRRILAMRADFRTYAEHIGGIALVGVKRVAA